MDAVEAVFMAAPKGPKCWRALLAGEALEFVEQVEARMEETGRNPRWTLLAAKLAEMGVDVSDFTIGRHYRGRCRCQ